ncbi:MAG: DUF1570 domain-containing protein [Phycisphaerales bacterium]|nr:DUF1570 domain-containing protein [Phycisphaerales bacterium]
MQGYHAAMSSGLLTIFAVWIAGVGCRQNGAAPPGTGPPPPAPHVRLGVAGGPFRVHRTDHFVVSHNTSTTVLRGLVNRLDRTYEAVMKFADARGLVDPARRAIPLEVLFFDSYEEYAAFARTRGESADVTAGFYHSKDNVAVFYNTLNRPDVADISRQIEGARAQMLALRNEGRNGGSTQVQQLQRQIDVWQTQRDAFVDQANRVALMHEAAHQCLFNLGVHAGGAVNPTWLVEGLACLFEVPQNVSGGIAARINGNRLADLRSACAAEAADDPAAKPDDSACIGPLPLRDFVSAPGRVGDRSRADIAGLYAQSWAVVCFLQAEHAEQFTQYLCSIRARKPDTLPTGAEELALLEAAFGAPVETLERDCAKFLRSHKAE